MNHPRSELIKAILAVFIHQMWKYKQKVKGSLSLCTSSFCQQFLLTFTESQIMFYIYNTHFILIFHYFSKCFCTQIKKHEAHFCQYIETVFYFYCSISEIIHLTHVLALFAIISLLTSRHFISTHRIRPPADKALHMTFWVFFF